MMMMMMMIIIIIIIIIIIMIQQFRRRCNMSIKSLQGAVHPVHAMNADHFPIFSR